MIFLNITYPTEPYWTLGCIGCTSSVVVVLVAIVSKRSVYFI